MYRKFLAIPLLLLTVAVLLAAGCGSTKSVATRTHQGAVTPAHAAHVAGNPAANYGSSASGTCPTKNTKTFANARFVADVGLAFGAFHHFIYKPYKAGRLSKGASGRTKALTKAAAAGGFAAWRLNAAHKMLSDSPLLCKTLKAPMSALISRINGTTGSLKSGDLSSIDSTNAAVEGFRSSAGHQGVTINDRIPSSLSTS